LLERAAVEVSLKTSRSPRILHLATHGFFLPDQQPPEMETSGRGSRFSQRLENPLLRSGLALAGANTWLRGGTPPPEAEDGLLTAEDVSGLDLLATQLVVLSACETGLGQVQIGEGVFGLRRAFMLAGAKTLVMSLWKVSDHETQQLMGYFYQGILKGRHRADALREAQLALKAAYPHPRYWGAFICQGDPSPLPQ
jgi:CHAT domain-containing protein